MEQIQEVLKQLEINEAVITTKMDNIINELQAINNKYDKQIEQFKSKLDKKVDWSVFLLIISLLVGGTVVKLFFI